MAFFAFFWGISKSGRLNPLSQLGVAQHGSIACAVAYYLDHSLAAKFVLVNYKTVIFTFDFNCNNEHLKCYQTLDNKP